MKPGAYPARMMKPKYQARKKIVAGSTQARRFFVSSLNSGDSSAACQSISEWWAAPEAPCPSRGLGHHSTPLLAPRLQGVPGMSVCVKTHKLRN